MADFISIWATAIMKHVPIVTWVGLSMAGILAIVYMGKRYRECALLSAVCAAYAVSPYLPHF